ncbi:MAG: leucine-rich repeat domain-containing protein [Bacteroidales bacterium]|nr:leucine-rich repeat domain-containing protein [Bacteroidales bacterium]
MKRLLFSLVAVLFAITAIGQTIGQSTTIGNVEYTLQYYEAGDTSSEIVAGASAINRNITSADILGSVTIGNQEYDVVVASQGFYNCKVLSDLTINDGVRKINSAAFGYCLALDSITFPASLECLSTSCFYGCTSLRVVTCLSTEAPIFGCGDVNDVSYVENTFASCTVISTLYLPFGSNIDSYNPILHFFANIGIGNGDDDEDENENEGGGTGITNFVINEGDTVIIPNGEIIIIPESAGVINNGDLIINDGGQLVLGKDMTGEGGTSAMAGQGVSGLLQGTNGVHKWCLMGAPFEGGYKLAAITPDASGHDVSISLWNYNSGVWNTDWATIHNSVTRAEGFFVFPFHNNDIKFTTKPTDEGFENEKYSINNGDFTVEKNAAGEGGNWVVLANPYTFNLDVAEFLSKQEGLAPYNNVQGGVVYTYNGANFVAVASGEVKVADGFFLNYVTPGEKTITFKEKQGRWYTTQAKASTQREFVRLAMLEGEIETEVLFAQNDEATEEYDIFDANKLFSPVEITEPYFVVNNIALAKEEVNTLPYYATMNVKSYGNKEVTFKANYIPEGLSVSIIDGEETIDLGEGVEYTTNVIAGENADRFKVLIKKSLSISDAEELEVNIYNDNRHINIETMESDLQVEVYNALGQKVLSTTDRNFTLNQVSAGAYVVKAFNNKASKTQKIVVKQ